MALSMKSFISSVEAVKVVDTMKAMGIRVVQRYCFLFVLISSRLNAAPAG